MDKKYPDMFYNYAFSGQAKCRKCENLIKQGQFIFVFEGNLFHDFCSQGLEKREKLEGLD